MCRDYEITEPCDTLKGGVEKKEKGKKRQALSDSVLTLTGRRHYRHSYLVQNSKKKCQEERDKEESEIYHSTITLRRVIILHPDIVQIIES